MARPRKQVIETPSPDQAMAGAMEQQESIEQEDTSVAEVGYGEDVVLPPVENELTAPIENELGAPVMEESEPEEVYSDEERRAIESGWTPKEAFQGDTSRWRDAKAWNERNNINSIVSDQKRKIAEMEARQDEVMALLKEERARNAQSQLASIELDRDEAIRNADVDKVKQLDAIIYGLKGFVSSVGTAPVAESNQNREEPQEVKSFKTRNKWFNGEDEVSKRKTAYAQFLENDLNMKKTTMSLSDKLAYIENEVGQIFDKQARNIAPVETRRTPMSTNNSNGLPDYNALPVEAKRLIEYYASKEEFKAKRNKKPFNKAQYRANYVKSLISDRVIDSSGKTLPQNRGR